MLLFERLRPLRRTVEPKLRRTVRNGTVAGALRRVSRRERDLEPADQGVMPMPWPAFVWFSVTIA
jgi:hypothetical protein